ncbi:hypothetical protein L6R49_15310 [Myxococcota bacterium]|nr:hypothetical protein [Myxococcota bacterium]
MRAHPLTALTLVALCAWSCGDKETAEDDTSDDVVADDSEGDADADTDSDSDTDLTSTAAGNIDLRDGTDKGVVSIQRAFSFYSSSATFIIASSNPDATCETYANLLDPDAPPTDRTSLYLPGHCNLSFTLTSAPPLASYDLQTDTGAVVGASCAFGEGEWALSTSGSYKGYYWTGDQYEAAAWKGTFSVAFTEEGGEGLSLEVELREWEGSFPYATDRPGEHKASGKVVGSIHTEHCPGFERSSLF